LTQAPVERPSRSAWISLGIVYVVWGSTYLAIRIAVRDGTGFPPFILGVVRLGLAGGLLLGWAALRKTRLRLTRSEALTLGLAALLMWPAANGLVNWAEQRADSGYAALLVGSIPIWTATIEAILDRRRPSLGLVGALAVGFAGLALLTVPQLTAAGGIDVLSIVALLIAPVTWAAGSILQTRRPVATTPIVSAAYLHLFGALGFVVFAAAAGESIPAPSAAAWGACAYLVIAGSVLAFTSYVRVLRLLPTKIVMTYAYVNPVIAVILGALLLHERVPPIVMGGMALVLLGVWGVFRDRVGTRPRPRPFR
jgi:drug/metabolite transporter (DMT)-like permease